MDPEIVEFEEALLRSIDQAQRVEFAAVHTPEKIMASRGRPRGSTKPDSNVAVKLRLDPDVLAALRASGQGGQMRMNDLLCERMVTTP